MPGVTHREVAEFRRMYDTSHSLYASSGPHMRSDRKYSIWEGGQ